MHNFPNIFKVIPLFSMITLAFVTKNTIFSVLCSIMISNTLFFDFNFIKGILSTFTTTIPKSLNDKANIKIILFTLFTNGFINLLVGSDMFKNLGLIMQTKIKTNKDTFKYIMVLCFIMFFDDYSSILVAGKLAPILFKDNTIDIRKVSYIIHTLSGTKAIFMPISTYAAATLPAIGKLTSTNEAFKYSVYSMPYQYYSIFTIMFLIINLSFNVNFWGMIPKEQVEETNKKQQKMLEKKRMKVNLLKALLPVYIIIIFIVLVVGSFFISGIINSKENGLPVSLTNVLSNFNSDEAILAASQCCLLLSIIVLLLMRKEYFNRSTELVNEGFNDVLSCLLMVILFDSFRKSLDNLETTKYISSLFDANNGVLGAIIKNAPFLIPPFVFLLSFGISLLIASSWGSLGIVPGIVNGLIGSNTALLDKIKIEAIIGAMLSGCIVGDHLSFYSDTANLTISITTVDKMEHYHAQKWYGLFNIILSLVIGYFLGHFITPYCSIILGLLLIVALHYYYKKKHSDIK